MPNKNGSELKDEKTSKASSNGEQSSPSNSGKETLFDTLDGNSKSIFQRWYRDARVRQRAHIKTNVYYSILNQVIGITLIILSTLAASSFFANVAPPDSSLEEAAVVIAASLTFPFENSDELRLIAAILSILAAILAVIQTLLKLPEKAEKHHQASVQYGDLRRDLECFGLAYRNDTISTDKFNEKINEINDRQVEIDKKRPFIPQIIYCRQEKKVNKRPYNIFTDEPSARPEPITRKKSWFKRLKECLKEINSKSDSPKEREAKEQEVQE